MPQRKAARDSDTHDCTGEIVPKVGNSELMKEYGSEPADVNYLHIGGNKRLKASYDTYATELLVRSCPRAVSKSQLMLQAKMEGFRTSREAGYCEDLPALELRAEVSEASVG